MYTKKTQCNWDYWTVDLCSRVCAMCLEHNLSRLETLLMQWRFKTFQKCQQLIAYVRFSTSTGIFTCEIQDRWWAT